MTTEIKPGTRVFNRAGQVAKYEGLLNGVHYVIPQVIIYDYEGREDTDWGEPTTWPEVFPKAPVAVLDEKVAELSARVKERQDELDAIGKQFQEQTAEHRDFVAKLEKAKPVNIALQRLLDFLDGKITHVVIDHGHQFAEVKAINDIRVADTSRYTPPFRLISLLGDSKGDLSWKISTYESPSTSQEKIHLCRSEAEAIELRNEIIFTALAKEEAEAVREGFVRYGDDTRMSILTGMGLEVPPSYADLIAKDKLRRAERAKAEALENVAKAEAAIAALTK